MFFFFCCCFFFFFFFLLFVFCCCCCFFVLFFFFCFFFFVLFFCFFLFLFFVIQSFSPEKIALHEHQTENTNMVSKTVRMISVESITSVTLQQQLYANVHVNRIRISFQSAMKK